MSHKPPAALSSCDSSCSPAKSSQLHRLPLPVVLLGLLAVLPSMKAVAAAPALPAGPKAFPPDAAVVMRAPWGPAAAVVAVALLSSLQPLLLLQAPSQQPPLQQSLPGMLPLLLLLLLMLLLLSPVVSPDELDGRQVLAAFISMVLLLRLLLLALPLGAPVLLLLLLLFNIVTLPGACVSRLRSCTACRPRKAGGTLGMFVLPMPTNTLFANSCRPLASCTTQCCTRRPAAAAAWPVEELTVVVPLRPVSAAQCGSNTGVSSATCRMRGV